MRYKPLVLLSAMTLLGCSGASSSVDAGTRDAGASDAGTSDARAADALDLGSADLRPDAPPAVDETYPATLAVDGQLLLSCTLGGKSSFCALDTGASPTAVHQAFAPTPLLAQLDVSVGPIRAQGHTVGVVDLSRASSFVGWPLGALIGSDLLSSYHLALDYRSPPSARFSSVAPPPPAGTAGPGQAAAFSAPLGVPVVRAILENGGAKVDLDLIADTGSGVTVLKRSTFDALVKGGPLAELAGYRWHSNSGSDAALVTRLPQLKVGGAEVQGSWAIIVPDDHHLVATLQLAGLPTEFLGYPFYRRFVTVYSGPDARYVFHPIGEAAVPPREWQRVGVELTANAKGFTIEMVYEPSSAKTADLRIGDRLIAIDGKALAGRSLAAVRETLSGAPGDKRKLSLERDGQPLEIEVAIDDLLPS